MATDTKTAKKKPAKAKSELGRLSSLGIKELWQLALYVPKNWEDLTNPISNFFSFFAQENSKVLLHCRLSYASSGFTKSTGVPKIDGAVSDPSGNQIQFSMFGDNRKLAEELEAIPGYFYLLGKVSHFKGRISLKEIEIVDEKWIGKFRPAYAGKPKVITPSTVRERTIPLLRKSIPLAARHILDKLNESSDRVLQFVDVDESEFPSLEHIIAKLHVPKSIVQGQRAVDAMKLISGWLAIKLARANYQTENLLPPTIPNPVGDGQKWMDQLPFKLSGCQLRATMEIIKDLQGREKPMRRILVGDVGYGKTAVFATAAATAYEAGARIGVLMPNETLAEQASREIKGLWPELSDDVLLFTSNYNQDKDPSKFKWLVGTTALLFAEVGKLDLLIVDEQQKFSREQREQLLSDSTHLLEATATCIPRSQALTMFGGMQTSILDEPPKERFIETVVRGANSRRAMMDDITKTIEGGFQVLIVYPRKNKDEEEDESIVRDVETAYNGWNKIYPSEVRLAHSNRSEDENETAIKDMRENKAKILISTTVVEVGVNIPNLRRTIIAFPERFGLSTLHQIRGRTARTGGLGHCDLYTPEPIAQHSKERLDILVNSQNGFEIALKDLMLRGCGNLSNESSKQTGSDDTVLFGVPLTPDILEAAINIERNMS